MSRLLIFFCFLLVLSGCKRRNQQVVALKNASSESIYFIVSTDSPLTNPDAVAHVRPITPHPTTATHADEDDQAAQIRHALYRYRVEADSTGVIMTSESAGIFINSKSVQHIIDNRYNGRLSVFVVTENNLLNHSDRDILDNKLYTHFKTLTAVDIKEDTLTLEYR